MLKDTKDKTCQLCLNVTKEEVSTFVGGPVTFAHKSCIDIVERYFKLNEKYKHIMKKIKKKHKENGSK